VSLWLVGFPGVAVSIQPNPVAELAAKQLVNRHAERLAYDVVQRVFDAGDGKDDRRVGCAAIAPAAPQNLVQRTNFHRVLPDQARFEMQNRFFGRKARSRRASRVALTGSDDALVRINADEGPDAAAAVRFISPDHARLHIGNLHKKSPCPKQGTIDCDLIQMIVSRKTNPATNQFG